MNKEICGCDVCTGCAACRDICPKHCITMHLNDLDAIYPLIDENICINCGLCVKTCPNNIDITFNKTQKVWAAWSNNDNIRKSSASGGIACELYHYWLRIGGVAAGVVYNREEGCHFTLIEKDSNIYATQNSKYTFSDTYGIYKIIKRKLIEGVKVLFIGVPCQIAGLYGFLGKEYDNLTTVDIICHGMPPAAYLEQHILDVEKHYKEKTHKLFFRDPRYHTHTYTFTLINIKGKEFYRKKVLTRDNYQLGYHRALIYRENCYSCRYAKKDRIADLTIGDFSGLGKLVPFDLNKHNVSCVLQNTAKGEILLESLKASVLTCVERPADEAYNYEMQLNFPSKKHKHRFVFEEEYKRTHNFKRASDKALFVEKNKAQMKALFIKFKCMIYNILVTLRIKK